MEYAYTENALTITVDEQERAELEAMKTDDENHFLIDDALYDFMEPLVANSELNWVDASQTGDLTDAPMLGIINENGYVLQRWAFMDYVLTSPLERLLSTGQVIFVG